MSRFPLSIDLTDRLVFLIGNGPQIRQKEEKLAPFGPKLIRKSTFTDADAALQPAMVIVGDTGLPEAECIYSLCCRHSIAVNVVDVPRLCSFYFPALITRGNLTVSLSTGGSSPAAAAYLRQIVEAALPDNTEAILDWLCLHRETLKQQKLLQPAIQAAFTQNRPLTETELAELASAQVFSPAAD